MKKIVFVLIVSTLFIFTFAAVAPADSQSGVARDAYFASVQQSDVTSSKGPDLLIQQPATVTQ